MKNVLLIVLGLVVLLIVLVVVTGFLIARDHVAATRAEYRRSADEVWDAITDIQGFTSWRQGLQSVEQLPDRDGHRVWREKSGFGPLTLIEVEATQPRRLVTQIDDTDQPFGGKWTFDLEPVANGCRLTITEAGFIKNPLFRALARFVFGYHSTQETYLRSLAAKFGATAELQRVQ